MQGEKIEFLKQLMINVEKLEKGTIEDPPLNIPCERGTLNANRGVGLTT